MGINIVWEVWNISIWDNWVIGYMVKRGAKGAKEGF